MRSLRLFLALTLAVGSISPVAYAAPGDTPRADMIDCMGAYGAMAGLRDSLAVTTPALKDIPNFTSIDFASRKAELVRRFGGDTTQINAGQSRYTLALSNGALGGDIEAIRQVLDAVGRCDNSFGFRPILGLTAGTAPPIISDAPAIAAADVAPPPASPQPAPAPVAPAVVASVMDDRGCAVAYLALSWGNGANQVLAKALLQRAVAAGNRYRAANPSLALADVQADVQAAAKARLQPIIDNTDTPYQLYADARACDAQYKYGPPEGATP